MPPTPLDADGQPPERYYRDRVDARLVAELLGVCKGILADGVVNKREVRGLTQWIVTHTEIAHQYPCNSLVKRLEGIYADGVITEEEQDDLRGLLQDLTGIRDDQPEPMAASTLLEFDDPLPSVIFDSRRFCFTGRLISYTRQGAEKAVTDRGGSVLANPTRKLDYLVVGPIGSAAWIQSTHGLKLLKAIEIREKLRATGKPGPAIIPEEHWLDELEFA